MQCNLDVHTAKEEPTLHSRFCALTSHQDYNVTPLTVVHPANGIQINMVAAQDPEELKVVYGSTQRQQDDSQLQQNFQGLHHQQTNIASTGIQHPKQGGSACTHENSSRQLSSQTDDGFDSSLHAAAQSSSYFETSSYENSERQCVYKNGQQRECLKLNFSRHFQKGSSVNGNNRLQQRQHLNCAFSASNSSVALKGESLGVTVQSFPLRGECSLVPENKPKTSYPLLCALLTANSSLDVLSCGQTQNLDLSNRTHSTPHKQQVTSPTLNGQLFTDKASPVGETDDQIQDFIAKKIEQFTTVLTQNNGIYGHTHSNMGRGFCTNDRDSTLQSECNMPKYSSVANLPATSASDKEYVKRQNVSCAEQCTAAVGQTLQEYSSKDSKANSDLTPKSKKTGEYASIASKKHLMGAIVSPVENSRHAPKNESVENIASVDFDLPVKIHLDVIMPTNANGKLVHSDCWEDTTFIGSYDESFYSKWCDKDLHNGMTTPHYSLTALEERIASLEKVETIAEMDNFSKVTLQQYWNGDIDNVHLFTSTEYPKIMVKVAATCSKNEDESPVVPTAVSLDEMTEKHLFIYSSPQEEYKSLGLNINKNFEKIDRVPGVSCALKHMTEEEKGETGLKPMEAVGLDNVKGVTEDSLDFHTKSNSVVTGSTKKSSSIDQIQIHNVMSVPTIQSEWLWNQTSRDVVIEDVGPVHSKIDLSLAVSENKVQELPLLPESKEGGAHFVKTLKDPQYEDISDDDEDMSKLLTEFPNAEHEKPQYEDISEDENPVIESLPSLPQLHQPNNKQSPFENESCGHVQAQAQRKMENISGEKLIPKKQESSKRGTLDMAQHCFGLCFGETDDGFEHVSFPKCHCEGHLGWQTNHSVSYSLSSVFRDGVETDDQMDDDFTVIPIIMSDLKLEPDDEAQEIPEKVVLDYDESGDKERLGDTNPAHCELHCRTPKSLQASLSSQIEVYDTLESFLREKYVQFGESFELASGRSTPVYEMDSEGEPHAPQKRSKSYSDPEDSCETEDSCDYSSASEHNYLTVSRQWSKKRTVPLHPETDESVPENENEHHEALDTQKGQTRSLYELGCMQKLGELIEAKAQSSKQIQVKAKKLNISEKEDIIILHSDTEDESDQNCKKKAKGKILFSSGSVDPGDAPCGQQREHSPKTVDNRNGTVKEKLTKNRLPCAYLPIPQHQSKLHSAQFKERIQDTCSDLSHSTETSEQLIETKTRCEDLQYETKSVVILDSDTDDDSDQSYKKASRRRIFSSRVVDGCNVPCIKQKRHLPQTVDSKYGTAKEKLQEMRLLSANSSVLQHQSKLHGAQLKEVTQNASSDLSHDIKKSERLIKAKCSEHVKHETNRQTTSKRIVFLDSDTVVKKDNQLSKKKEMTLSSVSKDSCSALFAIQNRPLIETVNSFCGIAKEKPQKTIISSEDSSEKKLQTMNKEADSTFPVIPHLSVEKSSQSYYLNLESEAHKPSKNETLAPKVPTAINKKTNSYEESRSHLYRDKQGRFVSRPKPTNDKHCATKNKVKANVTQAILVSRQLLLPSEEGPSTSTRSWTSTSGQLSEARQSSGSSRVLSQSGEIPTFCSVSKTTQSTNVPRQHLSSSKLKRSYSYRSSSTLHHPYTPTKGPSYATMQISARKQVTNDWHKSFVPTRRDRKTTIGMEGTLRTTNYESRSEARLASSHHDRAPRQRHNSHESATPLMKKTKFEAIQWTKAINRDTQKGQRYSVGEGYKWSEKPTLARPTKDSSSRGRSRSPQRPDQ